jgi:hypothetical protein
MSIMGLCKSKEAELLWNWPISGHKNLESNTHWEYYTRFGLFWARYKSLEAVTFQDHIPVWLNCRSLKLALMDLAFNNSDCRFFVYFS